MNVEEVNKQIKRNICFNTIYRLSDEVLLLNFKKTISGHRIVSNLTEILKEKDQYELEDIIDKHLSKFISNQTKSQVRKKCFDTIVNETIDNLHLNRNCFEIRMKEDNADWLIRELGTNKILLGINSIDIWKNHYRFKKGYDCVYRKPEYPNEKTVCVIASFIHFQNDKRKTFQMFEKGFNENSLCYLKNLHNIIRKYFIF